MQLASEVFGDDVEKLFPIIRADGSDSQKFDNCLEFLILSGRSLAHAMMMIPSLGKSIKIWIRQNMTFTNSMRANGTLGRISIIAFSDGVQIGAVLDKDFVHLDIM